MADIKRDPDHPHIVEFTLASPDGTETTPCRLDLKEVAAKSKADLEAAFAARDWERICNLGFRLLTPSWGTVFKQPEFNEFRERWLALAQGARSDAPSIQ